MRRAVVIACLTLASCAPQKPPAKTEFKGHALGEVIDLPAITTDWKLLCTSPPTRMKTMLCLGETTIGALKADVTINVTLDSRLTSVGARVEGEHFEELAQVLKDKYGDPSFSDTTSATVRTMVWQRPDKSQIVFAGFGSNTTIDYSAPGYAARDPGAASSPRTDL